MRKQILIVGAGFAGMWAALSAARLADKHQQAIDITVIAPQPELRVRPRFYESAVHTLVAPLQPLFDVTGVNFLQGHVEQILPDSKEVSWKDANGDTHLHRYDRLVLASGSHVNRDAVAGAAVSVLARAMLQLFYNFQCLIHRAAGLEALYADHGSDTAGIVLHLGKIQALTGGFFLRFHDFSPFVGQ